MACGTPVIAWRNGSVPEVIDHGLTGFIVATVEEAVDAVARAGALDRRVVRRVFARRFTAERMARDYIRVYKSLMATKQLMTKRNTIRAETTLHPVTEPLGTDELPLVVERSPRAEGAAL